MFPSRPPTMMSNLRMVENHFSAVAASDSNKKTKTKRKMADRKPSCYSPTTATAEEAALIATAAVIPDRFSSCYRRCDSTGSSSSSDSGLSSSSGATSDAGVSPTEAGFLPESVLQDSGIFEAEEHLDIEQPKSGNY